MWIAVENVISTQCILLIRQSGLSLQSQWDDLECEVGLSTLSTQLCEVAFLSEMCSATPVDLVYINLSTTE